MHDFIKSLYVDYFMKTGRHYIKPASGTGDKTKDMKKATPKVGGGGKTWDGVSRPSNDSYRINWKTIFGKE